MCRFLERRFGSANRKVLFQANFSLSEEKEMRVSGAVVAAAIDTRRKSDDLDQAERKNKSGSSNQSLEANKSRRENTGKAQRRRDNTVGTGLTVLQQSPSYFCSVSHKWRGGLRPFSVRAIIPASAGQSPLGDAAADDYRERSHVYVRQVISTCSALHTWDRDHRTAL